VTDKEKHLKDLEKFFDTDGVKRSLIKISLYLFFYEMLRNSVVDKIRDFYDIGWDREKGDIISKTYTDKIVNRKIDGKQNIFLSSLYWLEENGAITKDEVTEITSIREFRNDVAHRVDKILFDSEFNIDANQENRVLELIKKLEMWWIREVEIPTYDLDNNEIPDSEIIPGKEIVYTYIKNISNDILKMIDEKKGKQE